MTTTQKGRSSSALVIDASILRRITRVYSTLIERNEDRVLAQRGVSRHDILTGVDRDDARFYLIEHAREEMAAAQAVTVTLSFIGDRELTIDSIAGLEAFLEDEAGQVQKLWFASGMYRGTRLSLSLDNSGSLSAWYSAEGMKEVVDHLHIEVQRIIKDATADFRFLYGWPPNVAIRLGTGLTAFLLYALLVSSFKQRIGAGMYDGLLALWGVPTGFIMFVAADPLVRFFREAYPSCLFAFGIRARRTAAKRAAIGLLLTSIALPVLLAVAGLT